MPSGQDLLVLLIIVLVLFGAKKLPELARGLGQSVNEFKKAQEEGAKEADKVASSVTPSSLPPSNSPKDSSQS